MGDSHGVSAVIPWSAMALLLLVASGIPSSGAPGPMEFAQLIVREQILVRVHRGPIDPPPRVEWKEKRGPHCIRAKDVAGAALLGRDSVDLILRDNRRIRAKLEHSCPALDYYHGFYIVPNPDGRICADRDSIRSRVGGQCEIDKFRTLKAVPKR